MRDDELEPEIDEVFDWWDEEEPEPVEEDLPQSGRRPRGAYAPRPLPPNDGNEFMKEGACVT